MVAASPTAVFIEQDQDHPAEKAAHAETAHEPRNRSAHKKVVWSRGLASSRLRDGATRSLGMATSGEPNDSFVAQDSPRGPAVREL